MIQIKKRINKAVNVFNKTLKELAEAKNDLLKVRAANDKQKEVLINQNVEIGLQLDYIDKVENGIKQIVG